MTEPQRFCKDEWNPLICETEKTILAKVLHFRLHLTTIVLFIQILSNDLILRAICLFTILVYNPGLHVPSSWLY
jgi:hypothetical protein